MARFGDGGRSSSAPVPGGREHVYVLRERRRDGRRRMSRLPFNRPLRTGGENARIAAALERGWTGGNGPAASTARRCCAS